MFTLLVATFTAICALGIGFIVGYHQGYWSGRWTEALERYPELRAKYMAHDVSAAGWEHGIRYSVTKWMHMSARR